MNVQQTAAAAEAALPLALQIGFAELAEVEYSLPQALDLAAGVHAAEIILSALYRQHPALREELRQVADLIDLHQADCCFVGLSAI